MPRPISHAGELLSALTIALSFAAPSLAQTRSAFSDFQTLSPVELATLQGKVTVVGNQYRRIYTLAFCADGHAVDLRVFRPFYRSEFQYGYQSDYESPRSFTAPTAELSALIDSLSTLPTVTDGGVDPGGYLSFALSAVVDGSQRVFETVIDTAGERLLFAKMVPAFAGNATGSAEVVHFACVLGFLPGPPATDVTSQVSIRARGFRKNRRSEEYAGSVRITNTGGKPLDAPMMLVFRPGENITLVSGDGFTCAVEPSGAPFRLLPVGSGLGPGQHVDIVLRFQNPDDDPIQLYAARVFAGPGFR